MIWTTDVVYAGGGAKHPRPVACGEINVREDGLSIEPDDGYYAGTLSPALAVKLARAILAKWGDAYPVELNP